MPPLRPHSFIVDSATARVLVLSTPAGIEEFVRSLSTPAKNRTIPGDTDPIELDVDGAYAKFNVTVHGPSPFAG